MRGLGVITEGNVSCREPLFRSKYEPTAETRLIRGRCIKRVDRLTVIVEEGHSRKRAELKGIRVYFIDGPLSTVSWTRGELEGGLMNHCL